MVLIDRMSTPSQHLQSMDMLSAAQERMNRLQDQVSSGKAISRASDDPSATQSAMKLRAEYTRLTQVKLNVDNGLLRLNATMDQVDSINNQLLRVQDLLVQGQQPSATANVRSALAAEVNVLKETLLFAINSDFAGRQLFSGSSGAATAYDNAGNYLGDTTAVSTRVDPDSTVRTDVNGPEVLGTGAANAFAVLTSIASNLVSNPSGLAANQTSLDAVINTARGAQATVGTRITQLTELRDLAAEKEVDLAEALSAVEDTDLTKTIMELTLQQTGYEAALHATASVMQPSLMDFLR